MQVFTLGISENHFRIVPKCPNEIFGPANGSRNDAVIYCSDFHNTSFFMSINKNVITFSFKFK